MSYKVEDYHRKEVKIEDVIRKKRFQNLTGQTFGKLKVISFYGRQKAKRSNKSYTLWKCICKCGNEKITAASALKTGNTKSCGCLHKENAKRLPEGEAAFNRYYLHLKNGAKVRKYEFTLSTEEVKSLNNKNCYYCNESPTKETKGISNGKYVYNGIDRIDNSKGYIISNCVPCCLKCNIAKATMSKKEFLTLAEKIYKNHLSK